MGYLSFQIIFFLLLAALLGFIIGWLLRGSRFQTELKDLDGRWRTKLGEVESERDRFVAELTQANDAKAKLDAEVKRQSETHDGSIQKLRREHQAKLAAYADSETASDGLKADLAARSDELAKVKAELAKAEQTGGDSVRLGQELAAANARAADLEGALDETKTANASCRIEVDRLNAEIADLKRSGGGAGTASSGGALGLVSNTGSGIGGSSGTGYAGAGGSGSEDIGSGGGSGSTGLRDVSGQSGDAGGAGTPASGQSGGSDPAYTQPAGSPAYLAEAKGRDFGSDGSGLGSSKGAGDADDAGEEEEGVRPDALAAARDGKADDLKRISGVGPKLEQTLNGLGIFHFSQIAEFTPDNVVWVDRHLRFKGRIARENWIGQAKILAAGGETDFSKRQ